MPLPLVLKPIGELQYFEVRRRIGPSMAARAVLRSSCARVVSGGCPPRACRCATVLQKRKPVDLWGFIKSPYGLMLVVSLFFIFVIPRMKVGGTHGLRLRPQLTQCVCTALPPVRAAPPCACNRWRTRTQVDPEELKEMRAQLRGGATATAGGQQARIATRS